MSSNKHSPSSRLSQRRHRLIQMAQIDENGDETLAIDKLRENLSFCGCGFLGIYHVGVASCFHEYAPQISTHKIAGSSVGALVALAHLCGNLELAYTATDILRIAIKARAHLLGPFHPSFDINTIISEALDRGMPENVHKKVSGRLHISLTRVYDGENVIINQFESRQDVIQALICSCFIPFWSGLIAPKFKGVAYVDGGFSNNLLILDDKTVIVSPFAGEADICPQDDVYNLLTINLANTSFSITPHNLYRISHALLPPPPEMLKSLWERGFSDGVRFLQRMNLISCAKCLELRSSLITDGITKSAPSSLDARLSGFDSDSIDGHYRSYDDLDIRESKSLDEDCWYSEDEDCDDCMMRRANALRDPLPKLFTDRIREACDNVNKSLYNWLYSCRPIKYLCYLSVPYYLPMDLSLALFLKYWRRAPFGLVKCIYDLKDILLDLARRYLEGSTTSILMSSVVLEMSNSKKQQTSSNTHHK